MKFRSRKIYIKQESLKKFIFENKILDFILGENFHSEVFRRSFTIFKFLLETGHSIKLLGKIKT
jgi:hypothetical protein